MNTSLLNQILSPIASALKFRQRCDNSNNHDDDESSHFQATVCLYDWWLVKADKDFEGNRLAVAGFTSRDFSRGSESSGRSRTFYKNLSSPLASRLAAMRVFTSAPIVKRYDVFTLETADGICIVIKGFMNKSRTTENGFSAEVFSHFLFGFPTYWEAFNKKCLEEEFATGAGLANDINSSARGHESVAGVTIANPNTAPINYEVNGKSKQNVEDIKDCSENVSQKVTTNASKGSEWLNHAAEDNNMGKAKDHTSENLQPSMSCDINAVSLAKDNLALLAELSCYIAPSEGMANSKSCSEGSKGTVWKSKTQEPASLESLTINNAALEECPIPKASDVENLNLSNLDPAAPVGDSSLDLRITSTKSKTQDPACLENITISNAASGKCSIPEASDIEKLNSSNLDPAVPVGNPGVDLRLTSSRPKNSKQQEENDGVNCGNKDCSTFSLPQEFVATVRCTGEKSSGVEGSNLSAFGLGVTHTESLSTSPINEDPNYKKLLGNYVDGTMNFRAVESVINAHTNTLDVTPSNSGSRKSQNQNKHSGFTASEKSKSQELMSETSNHLDGENLKRCSLGSIIHSGKKMDILEAARSQSINRMVRNMIGNSKGKEKERYNVVLALKAKRNKMGLVATVVSGQRNLEGMNVFNFRDDELQQPIHDNVVKNNSKQVKDHRKEPQAGTPRQKPDNSDRSRNEFGDPNHQCESETAVREKEATAKGSSSKKKARRRINFDTQATPLTQGTKKNIVSPESLSLKRSRSGRLLLPSLDFWRNQIPVYDADRKITGIQVATPSKGSKSEPPKKRRR